MARRSNDDLLATTPADLDDDALLARRGALIEAEMREMRERLRANNDRRRSMAEADQDRALLGSLSAGQRERLARLQQRAGVGEPADGGLAGGV